MQAFKRLFDFYLQSSLHVALSCYALVRMTNHQFHLQEDFAVLGFVFFGTVVGYNFVKYDALARTGRKEPGVKIKRIAALSFLAFLVVAYCFFYLQRITQYVSLAFLALTLLYTLPFFPNRKNARNWAGVKIYIVSVCWVGVTLVLPLLNAHPEFTAVFTADFLLKCVQRFILVFVLVLVFEIVDLSNDDPHLHTVPQQMGVKKTKILGLLLLFPFYFLEFLKSDFDRMQLLVNLIMVSVLAGFIWFANEKKSRYYTAFWVESVPVFWWLLLLLF